MTLCSDISYRIIFYRMFTLCDDYKWSERKEKEDESS